MSLQIQCAQCHSPFVFTDDDAALLTSLAPIIGGKQIPLPEPTCCMDCRQQRRAAVANQLFLYKRRCDLTGESVVSNFRPDSPYKIIKQELWFSDRWDPFAFGRDFDFSRPFFDQWHELSLAVPRPSLFTGYQYDENSEYTNHSGKNKNCYMIFDSDENRDSYYCYSLNGSENCMECLRVRKSELSYGCIDSIHCYRCTSVQDCENCSDSMFLKNCIGCRHCLMSSNLRNKEYFIENRQATKEDFDRFVGLLSSSSSFAAASRRFEALKLEYPQKYMHGTQNEHVLGDYLTGCKNAHMCFDSADLWDCRYVFQGFMPLKTCMDIQECGDGERLYECAFVGYGAHSVHFSMHILGDSSDLLYCSYCPHSKHMFGCIGLRHKQYCIFNKQYTQEEYERLVPQIIEHMRLSREWGEFYPIGISYAAYNETLAQDFYPLTREQAVLRGYSWRDPDPKQSLSVAPFTLPDDINDVPDTVVHELLSCGECGKTYRIMAQELALYRNLALPLPVNCFNCRLRSKRILRNPRKIWERTCAECGGKISTTYAPDRQEKVVCEECYLSQVY